VRFSSKTLQIQAILSVSCSSPVQLIPTKQAAVKASIKLDAGDVKSAIRVLSSDDVFAIPNLTSYNILLTKHPLRLCFLLGVGAFDHIKVVVVPCWG